MHFAEQKCKLIKHETESKIENPIYSFRKTNFVFQSVHV